MKTIPLIIALVAVTLHAAENKIPNRLIDYDAFMKNAAEVAKLREKNRVTEEQFIKMAAEPNTVIYDARNDAKYEMLHIKGAKHLDLTSTTAEELEKLFPDKSVRILIYCNNNFLNEPAGFASKAPPASLNIYTFNTLFSYGYKNVYELGPLLDITKSKIPFEGTRSASQMELLKVKALSR